MAKMLQNERMKLYKKPSTWILSGILVALMLLGVIFIKVVSLLTGGRYYDDSDSWKYHFTSMLQQAESEYAADPDANFRAKYDVEKYKYILDNEISPTDWRTDAVVGYYNALTQAASLEYAIKDGDSASLSETETRAQIAALKDTAAKFKAVLDADDWKDLIRMRIKDVEDGTNIFMDGSGAPESAQEKAVMIEVLQMQIDLGVEPMPTMGEYYIYNSDTYKNQWKQNKLSTLKSNKMTLLRGEDQETHIPLTSSARAKMEADIAVITEELRTNTAPIDSESFLGMLDSTTSSLQLVTLLIVILAGGLIASEFSSGTVKLLLITPHKRQKIYWAKAMLLLEITAMILGATFVLAFICSAAFNGFGGIGDMVVMHLFGQVVRLPFLLIIFLKYLLFMLPVLTYGGLTLMLSAVTRKSAVAIAVSLLLLYGSQLGMMIIVMGTVSLLGAPLPGLKFLLFSNTDLSYYLPSTSSMLSGMSMSSNLAAYDATMSLGFSVVILLLYLACFLWIGRDSFCRRDIK